MTLIFTPDSFRAQVEAASGGHLTVLYDNKGFPSIMRVIPRFRYEDLGFDAELGSGTVTAFVKGGQEKSEIFIGQYQASLYDGRAVSLPGRDPRRSINYDDSLAACVDKGPGWHLMTMHEWAAIALWCKANDFEPRGNTDHGRAHDAHHEIGRRADGLSPGDSGTSGTLTGSGPATWRHDGTAEGIADLVGNVTEWQDLMKLVDGRVFAAPDNDWELDEGDWEDTEVDLPDVSSSTWNSQTTEGNQLTDRLLITHAGIDLQGSMWTTIEGERFPHRGGHRNNGSDAGLAYLSLASTRTISITTRGFRPAFAL
jgi:hypothetical protein